MTYLRLCKRGNIVINYIDNSATEDDLLEMKKRIDYRLAKIQTRKYLDKVLTGGTEDEELLRNSILTMEKCIVDKYKGPYYYDINFVHRHHIKIEADYSDTNIGVVLVYIHLVIMRKMKRWN
ncbi:Hypothetical protein ORPV_872 [Orpheovirus IHUMI-LCC2]|uniref:Uncharacterized protein n=1 Tax=Orpheovirus IHUMI-LCC2 TaxID=2023057 RepID=A0A2I2L5H9_9VIRU|nr:Hypothetical protein ORPV_872 [Orpheovirus IHUMI-LCC2]SNW62776.1 Hypothetical protein ORPV_872 [Orpheovirus IHUMI-LCC2]